MGKPSESPGFSDLLKEWNQKLADSGFKDIEKTDQTIRSGSQSRYGRLSAQEKQSQAQYYEIIGNQILKTDFQEEQEKKILCLYFEGFTQEQIRKQFDPPIHRTTVYRKLYKWLRAWGLK